MSRKAKAFRTAGIGAAGGLLGRSLATMSGLRGGAVIWKAGGALMGAGFAAPAIGVVGGVAIALSALQVASIFFRD